MNKTPRVNYREPYSNQPWCFGGLSCTDFENLLEIGFYWPGADGPSGGDDSHIGFYAVKNVIQSYVVTDEVCGRAVGQVDNYSDYYNCRFSALDATLCYDQPGKDCGRLSKYCMKPYNFVINNIARETCPLTCAMAEDITTCSFVRW